MVPSDSPFADRTYWRVVGGFLALGLVSGIGVHPVSPVVAYALLSNINERQDPRAPMDLSLQFIQQLQSDKADILRPWMIINPGQCWRDLPEDHKTSLQDLFDGLGIEVSG